MSCKQLPSWCLISLIIDIIRSTWLPILLNFWLIIFKLLHMFILLFYITKQLRVCIAPSDKSVRFTRILTIRVWNAIFNLNGSPWDSCKWSLVHIMDWSLQFSILWFRKCFLDIVSWIMINLLEVTWHLHLILKCKSPIIWISFKL